MKKAAILAMTTAAIVTASVGLASPLTDYSKGKTAVDLTWRQASVDAKSQYFDDSLNKKGNMEFAFTEGLGNKFAMQYTYSDAKSKETAFTNPLPESGTYTYNEDGGLRTQEFNILYKIDKHLSVYTGVVRVKGNINSDGYAFTSEAKNKMQFGLIGSTKLAAETTAYAQLGVASDYTKWKLGVAQEIAPNLELNVDYARVQAKKMNFNGELGNVDITTKGIGIGVSYKF